MTIPFKVKKLTETAKLPHRGNKSDLWDLFVDGFCQEYIDCIKTKTKSILSKDNASCEMLAGSRILIKTGISIELPIQYENSNDWIYTNDDNSIKAYAVADIRPRSGLAIKHGLTVLNTPGTIDNSYRKEIGVIIHNMGNDPYLIKKGDKIAQMLIRPLYPSIMEHVENIKDTGRGNYGSTGK